MKTFQIHAVTVRVTWILKQLIMETVCLRLNTTVYVQIHGGHVFSRLHAAKIQQQFNLEFVLLINKRFISKNIYYI